MENKKYLSLPGLEVLVELIKNKITQEHSNAISSAKQYTDDKVGEEITKILENATPSVNEDGVLIF